MKNIPQEVYTKIRKLNKNVKEDLKRKGIVAPIKNADGSITVGHFKIVKTQYGFYEIYDFTNDIIIKDINLPQSAALLANKLALGKYIDDTILNNDRRYGHALFEETLQTRLADKKLKIKDVDSADVLLTKAKISRLKKDAHKREILSSYAKLVSIG